ncbi:MAG: hypothetical protein WB660_23890 [Candidatus Sulfotelmatobacter sp.]
MAFPLQGMCIQFTPVREVEVYDLQLSVLSFQLEETPDTADRIPLEALFGPF